MNPYSLRGRLGEEQFNILTAEEYLAKLRVVADESAPPVERKIAKDDLLNAHLRLIAKTIRGILESARRKGGYTGPRDGVGIQDRSDLFNSMAGHVYEELTSIAVRATEGGFKLSTAIAARVAKLLFSKFRAAGAQKNTADFALPEVLDEHADNDDAFSVLETLLVDEAYQELKSTAEAMPGNQRLVFQALIYGFETGQDLTIAEIARALNIKETTARSAYHAAKTRLTERFPELANGYTD